MWSQALAGSDQRDEVEAAMPKMPDGMMEKMMKGKDKKKDLPPFDEVVTEDFKEVPVPPYADSAFYKLYHNKKDDQLLAVIPAKHLKQNVMMSSSISSSSTSIMRSCPLVSMRTGSHFVSISTASIAGI